MTVLIKFVISFMIINDNPLLAIVNYDTSLTIVNTIVNKFFFFKNDRFLKTIV